MVIEGIDLSSNNANWRSLDTRGLSLCIVKLTQGMSYHWSADPEVVAWARTWARWVMGYHWVDPTVSSSAQATFFADTYEPLGLDGWWLDIEDPHPPAVAWATLVPSIFDLVAARCGAQRGGNYKGRYFAPELNGWVQAHNWWLSDYRDRPQTDGCVIHQYTSAGGVDRNRVLDEAAFYRMVGQTPAPAPRPQRKVHDVRYFFQIPDCPAAPHGPGISPTTLWIGDGISGREVTGMAYARGLEYVALTQGYPANDPALDPEKPAQIPWAEARRMHLAGVN